jgi:hypothetical protein
MAVSSITTHSPSEQARSIMANAAAPITNAAPTPEQQPSSVVSLSQQGQTLSRSNGTTSNSSNQNQVQQADQGQNANPRNPLVEQREGRGSEAAERPGIQLLESEKNNTPTQGSRVNTYV